MSRAGTAASADDRGALVDRGDRVLGHVPRRRRVHEPAPDTCRAARVRTPRDGHVACYRHDHADQPQHLRGSLAAVHADHVGSQLDEASSDLLGRGSEGSAIVTRERGAREHREAGRGVSNGRERELHLAEVGLRLDHQQVHAPLGERRRLLQVRGEGVVGPDPPVGGQPHAQRAHRTTHHLRAGRSRETGAGLVDRDHPVAQAVLSQPETVRAERVRDHEFGARVDERPMQERDPVGIVLVPRLHARRGRRPAREQRRAGSPVGEQRSLVEQRPERIGSHAPIVADGAGDRLPRVPRRCVTAVGTIR